MLSRLDHPNVMRFFGASLLVPNICIVTEFLAKGKQDTIARVRAYWQLRFLLVLLLAVRSAISCMHHKHTPAQTKKLISSIYLISLRVFFSFFFFLTLVFFLISFVCVCVCRKSG